ncbi:glutamate--tRNA ligase [Cytophagaceae bacterium 50C-KIRBA]|uniref:Glutamate--tRNA ligase n=1 Tax=Aquirufa beregesia TaxID=2516556 RepID=A0ABX0EZK5_9BACT|nr:glutamate--tRNA ligase [Aquirufa beregesia]NGZ44706.1 glutamate--tRNA ligase [Aquirufa beregesia]
MPNLVRVRFAPSPTGPLHIGGVRTALYNFLLARKLGGTFILRIEDTDQARFVSGAEAYILESLAWLGISPDEGIGVGGPFEPYRQSERKDMYKAYADELIQSGKAYYAFDTSEELDAMRTAFESQGSAFQYNAVTRVKLRNSLALSKDEVDQLLANNTPYVIRLKVPAKGEIRFQDIIRDWVHVHTSSIDDKVLMKSDGMPTYHLANVVDDHIMQITHVIRGEEWLPSAPLHILLYQAFGWNAPQFAHLPLLLKPEGNGKLSKRDADLGGFPVFPLEWKDPQTGAISKGFKQEGYLPEATLNFLAFLGWNPGTEQELFSLDELIAAFSLERINKAGAKFDVKKAQWFNEQYLKQHDAKELAATYLPSIETEKGEAYVHLFLDRITFPQQLGQMVQEFSEFPESYDEAVLSSKWNAETKQALELILGVLPTCTNWHAEEIKLCIQQCLDQAGIKMGKVMQLFRVAMSGKGAGPDLMISLELWGKEQVIARLSKALEKFPAI